MQTLAKIPIKTVEFLHGEPIIKWKKTKVKQTIVQHGLQLAVLGKFSYGKHVITKLRKAIPIQCELKGDCSTSLIEDNHVLIRLSLMEHYVHLHSKPAFYLKAQGVMWKMRCTMWNPWWMPDEETPIAIAWITFP